MKRLVSLLVCVALILGVVAGCAPKTAPTPAKETVKVKLLLPVPVKTIAMYPFFVAEELGYFKEEALDVTIEMTRSSTFIVQQIAAGAAEAGLVLSGPVMGSFAEGYDMKSVYEYLAADVWDAWVPKDSDIKSYPDLRGKVIGVASLVSGEIPELTAALRSVGLTPGVDVQFFPHGESPAPSVLVDNLRQGRVHAVVDAYNDMVAPQMLIDLRRIPRPKGFEALPRVPIIVSGRLLKENRQAVVGLARAVAKGTLFGAANPDATLAIMKSKFPPEHEDAKFAQVYMRVAIETTAGDGATNDKYQFGTQSLDGWKELQKLMLDPQHPGALKKDFDLAPFVVTDLLGEINKFDRNALRTQAKNYKP